MPDGTATQNTIDTAPVFAPDGSVRQIPYQQLRDALTAGGKLAVQMKAPNGDVHYVPHDQIGAAAQAGGKVNSEQGTIAEPKPQEGFWHSLGSVFWLTPSKFDEAQKKAANMSPLQEAFQSGLPPNPVDVIKSAGTAVANEYKKGVSEGQQSADALQHGDIKGFLAHQIGQVGHAAATVAAPVMGENLSKAGEQLGQGNVKGALGTATGLIAPVVAGGMIGGDKPVPRSALSKTIKPANPVEFHAAEQSVIPKINAAAQDLGQPIKTANDALSAIRQAKQSRLLEAHEAAGSGNTIADLPADQVDALQKDMGAFDTLKQHIEDAQKAASAKAPKPAPSASGMATDIVGTLSPRAAHAINLAGKVSDVFSILKGKNALTPANLDASIESTFGSVEAAPSKTIDITAAPSKSPHKPAEGDLSVKHEGNIQPPETPHGDATVSPDRPNSAIVSAGSTAEPLPSRPASIGPNLKPVGSTAELDSGLTGVKPQESAPAETEQKAAPNVRGSQLDPAGYLTLHGAEDGETAALMQLTHTGGQALRNIAKARGLKIPASADNVQIIQKIHDDLSPQEISAFNDAAQGKNAEREASLGNTDPAIVADNKEVAQKLYSKADEMQANGESPYRIRAWRTAAENIETRPTSVKDILDDTGALRQIKGVDSRMAQHIQEVMQEKQMPAAAGPQEPKSSAPYSGPNRRTDLDLRAAIAEMKPEEQVKALYQSDKTELPNKRAFDWVEKTRGPAKAIGMSDADGLKAMNDKHGYAAGDALLKAKADALREAGLEAFHDKGDEFLFRGDSPEDMAAKLDKAKDILQNKIIEFKDSQGNVRHFSGAQFSYGTGSDLSTAEAALKANKSGRKASGAAAGRGEMGSIKEVKP